MTDTTLINPLSTLDEYLSRADWRVSANANQGYSLGGMILNAAGKLTANYWLDGIYTADPKKDPSAKRFKEIRYIDVLKRGLKVMDSTAFSLCQDNKMPIIVFDLFKPHNLRKVVLGEKVGTLVTG